MAPTFTRSMANQVLRNLEKKAKQMLWNLVGACAGKAPNPPDLPLDFTGIQTVLVIRPDRLGDVVLSTQFTKPLKKHSRICISVFWQLAPRQSSWPTTQT